jgi:hypothetical protein
MAEGRDGSAQGALGRRPAMLVVVGAVIAGACIK